MSNGVSEKGMVNSMKGYGFDEDDLKERVVKDIEVDGSLGNSGLYF